MCKYCDNQFIGGQPVVPLLKIDGGMELIIENGFFMLIVRVGDMW